MLVRIHPDNPDERKIDQVVKCLRDGGVVIFPTDTLYAIGADLTKHKALEKVAKLKGIELKEANFSIICQNLSHLADYAKQIDTPSYKVLKRAFPGPFTFILSASSMVPKLFNNKKKTIGIRVPNNKIALQLVESLGNPLLSTSVTADEDEVIEYSTNPELIYEKYEHLVDMVIDGGIGSAEGSTVVDFSSGELELVRAGSGDINDLY